MRSTATLPLAVLREGTDPSVRVWISAAGVVLTPPDAPARISVQRQLLDDRYLVLYGEPLLLSADPTQWGTPAPRRLSLVGPTTTRQVRREPFAQLVPVPSPGPLTASVENLAAAPLAAALIAGRDHLLEDGDTLRLRDDLFQIRWTEASAGPPVPLLAYSGPAT